MNTKVRSKLDELFTRARVADVSLSRLSRESGMSRVTLSNWKHGKGEPLLAAFLDVDEALVRLEHERKLLDKVPSGSA